jgi:hypothetical protein
MWCRVKLSEALTAITSLYDFLPPENMAFEATFAGINEDEKVVVRRQIYHGTWVASGPLNAMAPQYEVQETPLLPVRSFVRNAIGISSVADAIFGGHYRSHDPVILRFYSKLNNQAALDAMSLSEMVEMAHSILRETRKFSYVVGGPDEIGIFPAKGQPQLLMPSLPSEKKFATHFAPREGLLYTKEHPEGQLFGPNRMSIFLEDYQHPLDEVIPQFFLGCEFKDIPVVLDDNYFVRGAFGGVTFKYTGKPFLAQRNTYTDCTVEVPENVAPTGSEVFSHCRLVRLPQVTWEKGSVGEPLRWQSSGHQIFLPIH